MTSRIRTSLRILTAVAFAMAIAVGCSKTTNGPGTSGNGNVNIIPGGNCGTANGFSVDCTPKIRVVGPDGAVMSKNATKVISVSGDATQTLTFTVLNNGNSPLGLSSVTLAYTPLPGDGTNTALVCYGPDGSTPCASTKWPNVAYTGGTGTSSVTITIVYTKPTDAVTRTAALHIVTNDASTPAIPDFVINLKTASGVPKIVSDPEVDLGFVKAPGVGNGLFTIRNEGTADLIINDIDATALDSTLFTLVIDGKEYQTGTVFTVNPAIDLPPGGAKDIKVVYTGKDDNAHTGDIILHTNDPSLTAQGGPGWDRVAVKVNSAGPCLQVLPTAVTFGGQKVGTVAKQTVTLKACGDEPVLVTGLDFNAAGAGNFAIDYTSIQATGGKAPSDAAPLTIAKNAQATFNVTYTPAAVAAKAADGSPVLDTATVVVTAPASPNTPVNVVLTGFGSTGDCPTAVVQVLEGQAVVPQTVLHLDGSQSYANGNTIASYKWTVTQPQGSVSKYAPTDTAKAVTFTPNVAGDYSFCLAVTDNQGKNSCAPACQAVKVLPDQAIHVELIWDTPLDKDQSDEGPGVGSDLDLHFTHPFAETAVNGFDGNPLPWFDNQFDCYWFTCGSGKVLEWGSYDPNIDDNPHLDRDDTDGAGPENMNLTLPEDGRTYSVGVHYYDDHGFGGSTAKVRIYVYGALVYEASQAIVMHDLWYVATIAWSSADVEAKLDANKKPYVFPKYPAPVLN